MVFNPKEPTSNFSALYVLGATLAPEYYRAAERLSTALILIMILGKILSSPRVISIFRHEVDENCALLGCYAASSGNFLPTSYRCRIQGSRI